MSVTFMREACGYRLGSFGLPAGSADHLCRTEDLESCSVPGDPRLLDGDPGYGQDLPREEEAESGIHAVCVGEDLLLLVGRNPHPVILTEDGVGLSILFE